MTHGKALKTPHLETGGRMYHQRGKVANLTGVWGLEMGVVRIFRGGFNSKMRRMNMFLLPARKAADFQEAA